MSEDRNEVFPVGENRHQGSRTIRVEDDGTLRTWTMQVAQDATGAERPVLVENGRQASQMLWGHDGADPRRLLVEDTAGDAGHLVVSNYGWDGAALERFLLEADGEQKVVAHGKDEAANIDAFRTDPDRIQWVRPYDGYVEVPSMEIAAAEGDLWNPALADTIRYKVYFNVVNNDAGGAAAAGVYVGREIDSAGGLARPYYWMFDWTVPYPGDTGWWGPFDMHGDDAIRGVAAVANDASIHFRVRRVDVGA